MDVNGIVTILYRNWRGEEARRKIRPHRFFFGTSYHHPVEQWLVEAFDLDKNDVRTFAMANILIWACPVPIPPGDCTLCGCGHTDKQHTHAFTDACGEPGCKCGEFRRPPDA